MRIARAWRRAYLARDEAKSCKQSSQKQKQMDGVCDSWNKRVQIF